MMERGLIPIIGVSGVRTLSGCSIGRYTRIWGTEDLLHLPSQSLYYTVTVLLRVTWLLYAITPATRGGMVRN